MPTTNQAPGTSYGPGAQPRGPRVALTRRISSLGPSLCAEGIGLMCCTLVVRAFFFPSRRPHLLVPWETALAFPPGDRTCWSPGRPHLLFLPETAAGELAVAAAATGGDQQVRSPGTRKCGFLEKREVRSPSAPGSAVSEGTSKCGLRVH
jgi:hypothetical protein